MGRALGATCSKWMTVCGGSHDAWQLLPTSSTTRVSLSASLKSSKWRARSTSSSTCYILHSEELTYDYKFITDDASKKIPWNHGTKCCWSLAICHAPCWQPAPSRGLPHPSQSISPPLSCSGWMWACRWQGPCLHPSSPPSNRPLPVLGVQDVDIVQRFLNPFFSMHFFI